MTRLGPTLLGLGLGALGLAGCFVVSPYPPGYPYPPPAAAPAPAPRAATPAPGASGPGGPGVAAPSTEQDCQMVTVEGHNEVRVLPGGQRETVWVPSYQQRVCRPNAGK